MVGPIENIANELETSWMDDVKTSLQIDFVISRSLPVSDFTDTSFHPIHPVHVSKDEQMHIFPEPVYYIPILPSHNFNALRNNPQFRQSIITKSTKYRGQSGMRMSAELIPS